jgi:putative NADH-flavin reductase
VIPEDTMRVIVFGASRGTGRQVVARALAQGLEVTAFARTASSLDGQAHVVQGNVGDARAVDAAIAGHDAVISTLGVGKPLTADPVVVQGVTHIVEAMKRRGVRRLIYQSFIGVPESRAAAGWLIANVARHPLRHEITDHEQKEAVVRGSDLDWTIVRPPKLTDGSATGRYRAGEDLEAGVFFPRLSRADVADFIVRELLDATFVQRVARVLPS